MGKEKKQGFFARIINTSYEALVSLVFPDYRTWKARISMLEKGNSELEDRLDSQQKQLEEKDSTIESQRKEIADLRMDKSALEGSLNATDRLIKRLEAERNKYAEQARKMEPYVNDAVEAAVLSMMPKAETAKNEIIFFGVNGEIIYMNPAAQESFGARRDVHHSHIIDEEQYAKLKALSKKPVKSGFLRRKPADSISVLYKGEEWLFNVNVHASRRQGYEGMLVEFTKKVEPKPQHAAQYLLKAPEVFENAYMGTFESNLRIFLDSNKSQIVLDMKNTKRIGDEQAGYLAKIAIRFGSFKALEKSIALINVSEAVKEHLLEYKFPEKCIYTGKIAEQPNQKPSSLEKKAGNPGFAYGTGKA